MINRSEFVFANQFQPMNLRALDSLRGLLAIYVVAGHSRCLLWEGWRSWTERDHVWWADLLASAGAVFRYGHESVMIFFVLSGFFIHLRAAAAITSESDEYRLDLGRYYSRRSHRIVPPYFFALVVTVLVDSMGRLVCPELYSAETGFPDIDAAFEHKGYSINSVTYALFLLPSFMGQDFGTNGPLWSLGCEMIYYAIYPVWLRLRLFNGGLAHLVVWIGGLYAISHMNGGPTKTLVSNYPCWIAGAALAEWVSSQKILTRRHQVLAIFLGVGGMFAIENNVASIVLPLAYALLGVGAVSLFVSVRQHWSETWIFRWSEVLGIRSYTLYACHYPILVFALAWVLSSHGQRPANGSIAAVGFAVAVTICLGLFNLCERHFLHPRLKVAGPHVSA
jgi:peptidoglycan/LPS O-acetylase OafA/YrhL